MKSLAQSRRSTTVESPTPPCHSSICWSIPEAELFELAVRSGLRVFETMLEEDRTALCGPRYAHRGARRVSRRHGAAARWYWAAGRWPCLGRACGPTASEVPLPTFQAMANVDPLNRRVVEQMLVGVATRRYARSLEPVPATMRSRGTSKSAVSRRFVAKTAAQLAGVADRVARRPRPRRAADRRRAHRRALPHRGARDRGGRPETRARADAALARPAAAATPPAAGQGCAHTDAWPRPRASARRRADSTGPLRPAAGTSATAPRAPSARTRGRPARPSGHRGRPRSGTVPRARGGRARPDADTADRRCAVPILFEHRGEDPQTRARPASSISSACVSTRRSTSGKMALTWEIRHW